MYTEWLNCLNSFLVQTLKENGIRADVGSYYVFRSDDLTERLVLVPRGSEGCYCDGFQVRKCTWLSFCLQNNKTDIKMC